MNRSELIAIIERRALGATPAAWHTHIECFCNDPEHHGDMDDSGCFCPNCASEAAVKRGFDAEDIVPENEGPDDNTQWCEECGRLITLRSTPDLDWGISADGALEELEHFESGLGFERGEPKTPDDWQVFLLIVDSIDEEHLPRVEAIVRRMPSP